VRRPHRARIDLSQAFGPGTEQALCGTPRANQEQTMLDILMLALAAGLFALAIGYTYACERL
jgi:preprotein translocase subunit SecG